MSIRFTPRAERELEEVADWSKEEYGEDAATDYIADFHEGLRKVELVRGMSKQVPGRGNEAYRRLHRGAHWIYFLYDEQGLLVVRIVHERMLPPSQLS